MIMSKIKIMSMTLLPGYSDDVKVDRPLRRAMLKYKPRKFSGLIMSFDDVEALDLASPGGAADPPLPCGANNLQLRE